MLYISFNYRELHRLKETVFAPHMVNAGLKEVSDFLRTYIRQHWAILRHAQFKHRALGFLVTLEKARRKAH